MGSRLAFELREFSRFSAFRSRVARDSIDVAFCRFADFFFAELLIADLLTRKSAKLVKKEVQKLTFEVQNMEKTGNIFRKFQDRKMDEI